MPFEEVGFARYGWWGPHGYYHRFGIAPMYTPLCEGTCTLQLLPGHYQWALAYRGGRVVPAGGAQFIGGPATLRAEYVDRSGLRTAGVVIGVVGVVSGIVMIAESFHDRQVCDEYGYCYLHSEVNDPLLVGGIGVLLASSIVSAVLVSQRDEARISVTPLRVSNLGTRGIVPHAYSLLTQPQGAAVSIRF